MRWYRQLYYGDLSPRKCKRIRFCVKHNVLLLNTYIITLALSDSEQLDLIPARELVQKAKKCRTKAIRARSTKYDRIRKITQIET